MTTSTATPTLPTLEPRQATESAIEFGHRAFHFLLVEEMPAATQPTDVLDLALMASQALVTARDMADSARERLHRIRTDIVQTVARRQREARVAAAVPTPAPAPKSNPGHGARLRRPVPVLPPAGTTARPF